MASMKKSVRFATTALALTAAACGVSADDAEDTGASRGALTAIASFGTNPGNLKMHAYVPAGVGPNAPLVVALHGCTQSANDYTRAGWNDLAETWKFYVLYPEQQSANNQNKCFRWFEPQHTKRGSGEALSIKQMVDEMKRRHGIDASRVFVTGLSAGGAMTSVMLATYPDVFSAGAIMAGIPYRCASSTSEAFSCMSGSSRTAAAWGDLVRGASSVGGPFPRVSIWQGTADYTVRPANATELVKQWTNVNGIDARPDAEGIVDGASHAEYRDASGETRVETYTIPNMGHGTAVDPGFAPAGGCGSAGAYVLDANICSTYRAGQFFRLGDADPGEEPAPAPEAETDAGTPADGSVIEEPPSTGFRCVTFEGTVYGHVAAGRAVRCGTGNSYACAVGSNQQLGLWNMMPKTLKATAPGYYEVGACP
ncbi:MAG: PHB depolymerase family esterase [Labilithrix sp.]|nr:PHB depolymerase family esterase [Labilithrix sp.]